MSSILEVKDDIQEKGNVDTNTENTKEEVATETAKDIFDIIEEVSTESIATEAVINYGFLNIDESVIPVLADACAKYINGLKGNDEYEKFQKGKELLESGETVKWFEMNISLKELVYSDRDKSMVIFCDAKWDPEHGVGISLKNFSVGPQDSFL